MRGWNRAVVMWGVGLALGAGGESVRGQFSLQTIPVPGIPTAISGDGTTVVSFGPNGPQGSIAYAWSAAGGLVNLGALPGDTNPRPQDLSYDGSVIVGRGDGFGWRWTAQTGPVSVGALPSAFSSPARGVSRDGSVIVGESALTAGVLPSHAYRWTQPTGVVDLGTLPGQTHSSAHAVSGDGSVVVGHNNLSASAYRAFRWTEQTGMVDLGTLPGEGSAEPYDISDNGLVIVGRSDSRPFRWTAQTGMVDLTPQVGFGAALAVSSDGARILGSNWYWIAGQGGIGLEFYLTQNGVNLAGWGDLAAIDMSDDGRIIVGRELLGQQRNWIAVVPEPSSILSLCLAMAVLQRRSTRSAS